MKQFKFRLLIIIVVNTIGVKSLAYDISVENQDSVTIYYNYINDGQELEVTYKNGYNSYNGDILLPKDVTYMDKTLKVTSIGKEAFNFCFGLNSVTIPNSVTSIGEQAFGNCYYLTSIIIPNSVTTIEKNAFYCCLNLSSINIPNSVTTIGKGAFSSCGLTSLTIPNSVTSIGDFAFSSCMGLNSIVIPNSVTFIGESAFDDCEGLTSLTIPNSITTLSRRVFANCFGLTSVTIPNSVTNIENDAFVGTNFITVYSLIDNPFNIGDPFSSITYDKATLYVPYGTIDKYKTTKGWENFKNIEEGIPSGFLPIKDPYKNSEIQRYTMNGQQIKQPNKGINIIKMSDGTIKKVLIK